MSLKKYQNIKSFKAAREQGFTIVELLIVIIVIAILAALVITAYTGVQNQARNAERKTDINETAKALAAFNSSSGGVFTCAQFTAAAEPFLLAGLSSIGGIKVDPAIFRSPGQSAWSYEAPGTPSSGPDKYGCVNVDSNTLELSWTEEGGGLKTRTVKW